MALVDDVVVAFDVGATNTRARVVALTGEGQPDPVFTDIVTRVSSASELRAFVSQVVEEAEPRGALVAAVVALAGPVTEQTCRLTNWVADSTIELSALVRAGLPAHRSLLANDVVAGAWGALSRVEAGGTSSDARLLGGSGADWSGLGDGNLVYIAPGTGLGSAALVRHGLGPFGASAVGCETQHTMLPILGGEIARVAQIVARTLGHPLSWEDLVSGRGLVSNYHARCEMASVDSTALTAGESDPAASVAQAAQSGSDACASAAMNDFYCVLGRFAQLLALTFLPCAAVVIGGTSTERNLELIGRSRLAEEFADHRRLGDLLERIPLVTVGGELNLEGGIRLARAASSSDAHGFGGARVP